MGKNRTYRQNNNDSSLVQLFVCFFALLFIFLLSWCIYNRNTLNNMLSCNSCSGEKTT